MTTLTPARLREMIECASKANPSAMHYGIAEATALTDMQRMLPPATVIALCRIALAAAEYVEAFGNCDPLVEPYDFLRDALLEAGLT